MVGARGLASRLYGYSCEPGTLSPGIAKGSCRPPRRRHRPRRRRDARQGRPSSTAQLAAHQLRRNQREDDEQDDQHNRYSQDYVSAKGLMNELHPRPPQTSDELPSPKTLYLIQG